MKSIACSLACQPEPIPYLKAFATVALNTGMRRNEILSLTRKSIDWQNRTAALTETKNGEARQVYLNDMALEAFEGAPAANRRRAVPAPCQPSQRGFMRAVRRAGIEDFRLHDCRHTFASYQAMAGIQARGLQTLPGPRHSMTARYSHLSDAYLKAAVDGVVLGRSNADRAKESSNVAAS